MNRPEKRNKELLELLGVDVSLPVATLVKEMGISHPTYYNLLNKPEMPYDNTIKNIAAYVGKDPGVVYQIIYNYKSKK